jgi:hypothetical protein
MQVKKKPGRNIMKELKNNPINLQTEEPDNPFKDPNEPTIPDIPPNPLDPFPGHEPTIPEPHPEPEPFPTPPEPIPEYPPDVVF